MPRGFHGGHLGPQQALLSHCVLGKTNNNVVVALALLHASRSVLSTALGSLRDAAQIPCKVGSVVNSFYRLED